jgi:hypothetical protein
MNKILFCTFSTILILLSRTASAQDSTSQTSWLSKHPIELSVGSHAIGLPFTHFLSNPYYPEINIGLQSNLMDKEHINLNIVNGIGIATHPFNGDRYFINTYLRFKYKFPLRIYSQIGLGIAFNILSYPNEVYQLNNSGVYEKTKKIETEWYTGFNMEIGHHLKTFKQMKLDLFLKYSAGVNLFHHPEIPVFPYNSIQVGVRFYINQNN